MLALFQGRKEAPRLGTLRQLALFSTLSRLELRVVDGLLHERRFLKGEIIFDEGEEGQALHVVIAGRVLICKQGDPVDGRVTEIDAGVAFGSSRSSRTRRARCRRRAEEDCVLASLSRGDLESLLVTHAVIASKILLQLARQLGRQLRDRSMAAERRAL